MRPRRARSAGFVRRYVAGRTDITEKAREQYAWAVTHIEAGLGAISLARLDRDDVAAWIEGLAAGGQLGRRSIQICRNVLRAALAEAVDEGLIARSPAARVGLPRVVAKPVIEKAAVVWDDQQVDRFLEVAGTHRWADRVPPRRAVRPATKRGARAALGRRRSRGEDVAHRREPRRPQQRRRVGRRQERTIPTHSSRWTTRRCGHFASDAPTRLPNASPPARSGTTPI